MDNREKNHDPGSSKLISSVTDLMSELLAVSLLKVSRCGFLRRQWHANSIWVASLRWHTIVRWFGWLVQAR